MVLIDDQQGNLQDVSKERNDAIEWRKIYHTSNWIRNVQISMELSPRSIRRAIAARQSASNSGYRSIFSFLSMTSLSSSSISSTVFSSSSLFSLSDDVYSAIRAGFFFFFVALSSVVVCGRLFARKQNTLMNNSSKCTYFSLHPSRLIDLILVMKEVAMNMHWFYNSNSKLLEHFHRNILANLIVRNSNALVFFQKQFRQYPTKDNYNQSKDLQWHTAMKSAIFESMSSFWCFPFPSKIGHYSNEIYFEYQIQPDGKPAMIKSIHLYPECVSKQEEMIKQKSSRKFNVFVLLSNTKSVPWR